MPDCSAVSITAYLPDELVADGEKILAELSDRDSNVGGWGWRIGGSDTDSSIDGSRLRWEDYDCPWGLTTPRDVGVLETLRQRGIAYVAVDYGHYTWDGETEVWKPGMTEPRTFTSGVEGEAFVTVSALKRIIESCDGVASSGPMGRVAADTAFRIAVTALIPPEVP
jgi:hypothetical protein